MSLITLVRQESAGFAYSAHEKVIKLEMRKLQEGWQIFEQAGTKGGTLTETVRKSGLTFDDAGALWNDRVSAAKRAGFAPSGPNPCLRG